MDNWFRLITLLGDKLTISDGIATVALLISMFTFYWTGIRQKVGFMLVRMDQASMTPDFVLINTGTKDILVTKLYCAFLNNSDSGWYAPDHNFQEKFSIPAGQSKSCHIKFKKEDLGPQLLKDGELIKNGPLELYHKDVKIIVHWLDHRGRDHESHALIVNYGINKEGHLCFYSPLIKTHDLLKSKIS